MKVFLFSALLSCCAGVHGAGSDPAGIAVSNDPSTATPPDEVDPLAWVGEEEDERRGNDNVNPRDVSRTCVITAKSALGLDHRDRLDSESIRDLSLDSCSVVYGAFSQCLLDAVRHHGLTRSEVFEVADNVLTLYRKAKKLGSTDLPPGWLSAELESEPFDDLATAAQVWRLGHVATTAAQDSPATSKFGSMPDGVAAAFITEARDKHWNQEQARLVLRKLFFSSPRIRADGGPNFLLTKHEASLLILQATADPSGPSAGADSSFSGSSVVGADSDQHIGIGEDEDAGGDTVGYCSGGTSVSVDVEYPAIGKIICIFEGTGGKHLLLGPDVDIPYD